MKKETHFLFLVRKRWKSLRRFMSRDSTLENYKGVVRILDIPEDN